MVKIGRGRYCGNICRGRARVTHGGRDSRLYVIWDNMKSRCGNPKSDSYADYGGRGITVCQEWMDFSAFQAWSLANGYADNLEVDREKNHLGYHPDNCRWVTRQQNSTNKRKRRDNTSGFKGVVANGKRWQAQIKSNGIRECLGTFDTPEEASRAYDAASIRIHGEFGVRNFTSTSQSSL